jgi:hypothetical protein
MNTEAASKKLNVGKRSVINYCKRIEGGLFPDAPAVGRTESGEYDISPECLRYMRDYIRYRKPRRKTQSDTGGDSDSGTVVESPGTDEITVVPPGNERSGRNRSSRFASKSRKTVAKKGRDSDTEPPEPERKESKRVNFGIFGDIFEP